MKSFMLILVALLAAASPVLPEEETCVEVEIGGEKTPNLSCLNRRLQRQADSVRSTGNTAPLNASSPSVTVGGYNRTALKQQYGPNYGKSAVPWRPALPPGGQRR